MQLLSLLFSLENFNLFSLSLSIKLILTAHSIFLLFSYYFNYLFLFLSTNNVIAPDRLYRRNILTLMELGIAKTHVSVYSQMLVLFILFNLSYPSISYFFLAFLHVIYITCFRFLDRWCSIILLWRDFSSTSFLSLDLLILNREPFSSYLQLSIVCFFVNLPDTYFTSLVYYQSIILTLFLIVLAVSTCIYSICKDYVK